MKVLFVCLGNICRSPTAEGVFRHAVKQAGLDKKITIDSAGTADWHTGKAPDPRTIKAAAKRGYDLSMLKARQAVSEDFHKFDLILAMDYENLENIQQLMAQAQRQFGALRAQISLMSQHDGQYPQQEVPDPYYGGDAGFEHVLDQCESSSQAWVNYLQNH